MTKRAVSWLLGLALLNTAQAGGSPPSGSCCHIDITGLQKQLTAAEVLWKKRGPDPYRMNIDFESESGVHSFQLGAPRGESGWLFVSPVPRSTTPNVRVSMPVPEHADTDTISGLFAQVRSVLRSARGTCGVLKATFDPRDGHVLSLQCDNFAVTDDEFLLTTSAPTPEP